MRLSGRFINFAALLSIIFLSCTFTGCKGRTAENMEPTGDTVEVVIMQNTEAENLN